jgi:hypothetical protein
VVVGVGCDASFAVSHALEFGRELKPPTERLDVSGLVSEPAADRFTLVELEYHAVGRWAVHSLIVARGMLVRIYGR